MSVEQILRLLVDLGADVLGALIRRGAVDTEHEAHVARVADMLPADPRALLTDEKRAALEELAMGACGVTLPDILTRCANPQPCPIHGPTAFGARSTPPEPPPQKG